MITKKKCLECAKLLIKQQIKYCSKICYAQSLMGKPGNNFGKHWNLSKETKRKISITHLGNKHPMWGKKHSLKYRKKMSISAKNRTYIGSPPIMRGEQHPRWKGNSSEDYRERRRFQKVLQPVIFIRDNYTCQICDQYSGYLQVDHIKSWAKYPE